MIQNITIPKFTTYAAKLIMVETKRTKKSAHFSRYGEFLVSAKLSDEGWNVYSPMYDEYIDMIAQKFTCASCPKNWVVNPTVQCVSCKHIFSNTKLKEILAKRKCKKCGYTELKSNRNCPICKIPLDPLPTCNYCEGKVEMIDHICSCGSTEYVDKKRTIQVKSSRIEFNDKLNKSKNTYGIDMQPKDMISSLDHFFIWCLVDDDDRPHFLVVSVDDFKRIMGDSMKGTSFLKHSDRQHFSSKDFGKWEECKDKFDKLE